MTERVVMALKELPFDVSQWERFKAVIEPDRLVLVSSADTAGIDRALREAEIAILWVISINGTSTHRSFDGCIAITLALRNRRVRRCSGRT